MRVPSCRRQSYAAGASPNPVRPFAHPQPFSRVARRNTGVFRLKSGQLDRASPCHSLVGLVLGRRRQRNGVANVIAVGVRLPDFRQTAKGPGGDASAIIVHTDCARRSKRNGVVWRSRRNGRVWRSRGNDGRILEQAGRVVLRGERRACRQRGGERENAASNESVDPQFHGSGFRRHCAEPLA